MVIIKRRRTRAELQAIRDAAIDMAEVGAGYEWWKWAERALMNVCQEWEYFTTDQVWEELEFLGVDGPKEPRAMGALLTRARKRGWIERTLDTQPSTRPECHMRPIRVWKALVSWTDDQLEEGKG